MTLTNEQQQAFAFAVATHFILRLLERLTSDPDFQARFQEEIKARKTPQAADYLGNLNAEFAFLATPSGGGDVSTGQNARPPGEQRALAQNTIACADHLAGVASSACTGLTGEFDLRRSFFPPAALQIADETEVVAALSAGGAPHLAGLYNPSQILAVQ